MKSIVVKDFYDADNGVLLKKGMPFEESEARIKALESLGYVEAVDDAPTVKRARKKAEK